jgi:hypothetical protein
MTIALAIIAALLFLIADRIGVFSKNEAILPVLGFGILAYFYPIVAAVVAAVVGVFWLYNFLATLPARKRRWKYQPQIDALFEQYGRSLPLEHHEELKRLHYLMAHGNLDGYKTAMEETEEIVKTQFGGDWSKYLAALNKSDY